MDKEYSVEQRLDLLRLHMKPNRVGKYDEVVDHNPSKGVRPPL